MVEVVVPVEANGNRLGAGSLRMLRFVVGAWWRITITKSAAHHELIHLEETETKSPKYPLKVFWR
jgi:hypothetical protein